MAKTGPISAGRLKSFVERVEKLIEERSAIGGDIRDVFAEAKGVGYDVKTMRSLIRVRAMDAADRAEQETLLDTYMLALGMETSANVAQPSEEELEERASRIVHEADRCMALAIDGQLPKIAAIQELIGCSAGKAHKLRGFVAERISRSSEFSVKMKNENPQHDPETGELPREMSADDLGEFQPEREMTVPELAAATMALPPKQAAAVVAVLDALRSEPEPDLTIPSFLDQRKQAVPA